MNLKDKLVSKLLDIGKKHRILVYPMLALVAVVTAISHAVCWGRGNGKKMVASIMVVALLITQSLFLTSSAVNNGDDPNAALTNTATDAVNADDDSAYAVQTLDMQGNLMQADNADGSTQTGSVNVTYHAVTDPAGVLDNITLPFTPDQSVITPTSASDDIVTAFNLDKDYFKTDGFLYSDPECQNPITTIQTTDGTIVYDVYVKIVRTAYKVTFENIGEDPDAKTSEKVEVPSGNGLLNPEVTYSVKAADAYKFYKWGYVYDGLGAYGINSDIAIKFDNVNQNELNLPVKWTPVSDLNITYKYYDPSIVDELKPLNPDATSKPSDPFRYGDQIDLLTLDESLIENKGYQFAGWKIESTDTIITDSTVAADLNSGIVTMKDGSLTANPNVQGVTLVGQWEYKNIDIYVNDTKVDGTTIPITGTYGQEMKYTITAKYKDSTSSDTIQLSGMDELTSATGGLGQYGLAVTPAANSFSILGTPNNIAEKQYTFSVTDTNRENGTYQMNFTLEFKVTPLPVKIGVVKSSTTSGSLTKVYDNSNTISVKETADVKAADETSPACIGQDGIKVSFDPTATLLSDASGSGEDVGEGKTIRLKNPKLTGNQHVDCYELVGTSEDGSCLDVPNAASVTPRTLHVSVAYDQTSVRFGEQSPNCTLTITDANNIADGNNGEEVNAYNPENPSAFLETYAGLEPDQKKWKSTRKLYSRPGSGYEIQPVFATGGNYEVILTVPTFSVTRDTSNGKFTVEETPTGGYYSSYTIVAQNGYDMVRILGAGEGDIDESMSEADAVKLFSSGKAAITKDGTYKNIQFQLRDSKTGAISTIYTISEEIKIDNKVPEYFSHTVEPNKYVNQLGFGSYYHSQDNITGMTLTVTYRSEESPCEYLNYYFAGENAETVPATKWQTDMRSIGNNLYAASILVGSGYSGQLVLWATDTKQKESIHTKLVCYDGTNTNAELKDKYYEWMVEDNPPSATMTVFGNDGTQASTGKWYHVLDAQIKASDADSGLDEAEWTVWTPSTPLNGTTSVYGDNVTKDAKTKDYTFRYEVSGDDNASYVPGEYYFSAVVKDNAGNVVDVQKQGPFLFDGIKPEVTLKDDGKSDSKFQSDVTITMEVTEQEKESGIFSVALYKDNTDGEPLKTWNVGGEKHWSDTYDVTDSGTYILVATDVAGNVAEKTVKYSYISSTRPDKPSVSITKGENGEIGNAGWLIKDKPNVTINSTTKTSDNVPVKTYYKVTYKDASGTHDFSDSFSEESKTFPIDAQGDVTVEAWAVSEADCRSDTASESTKVDIDGPVVQITESVVDADGDVTINFQAIDLVSGVDTEKVFVNGNAVTVTDTDGVTKGSFKADGSATYTIVAYDNAGNQSEEVRFEPLELQVSPITSITGSTAHIEANVIKGTNALSASLCYIEYKKDTDTTYSSVLVNKEVDADGNIEMIYNFSKLKADTVYNYRVHAATLNSSEERVVEGSFKTLAGDSSVAICGYASYDKDLPDGQKKKPIYVNLYSGNTIIGGAVVKPDTESMEEQQYIFNGISNGTYRIVATNGTLSQEAFVTIEDGKVTYPENYMTVGGVNFELTGLSTRVVLDDGDVEVAVSGLEKIYDRSIYKGNITDADMEVVERGGRIDIVLHASYIKVSDVASAEQGIFADKLGKKAEIVRYINLYIEKNVYDENGNYIPDQSNNLTQLADPVTISFPLEDLAGQNIQVASLHRQSSNDYMFENWAGAEGTVLTHDYVIITTNRFSTYALYRVLQPNTYTVVWKDGDGNVLKTETVEEGTSATPPEGTPTKTPTKDYTYTFEGWDQDYSNVTKDMVILAWFYSTKQNDTEDPGTTENPGTTEQPGTTEGPKAPDANVTHGDNGTNGGQNTSKNPVKYTYMGASGSPKTGDAAPIVLLVCAMVFAGAGIVITIKKRKSF